MTTDPLKIVQILAPTTTKNTDKNDDENNSNSSSEESLSRPSLASAASTLSVGYVPPRITRNDDVLFTEPTFSEKFFRYLVIVIYLGGLSSLGFFLSVYYIFFWDSRMPPVYKPSKKPPVFGK